LVFTYTAGTILQVAKTASGITPPAGSGISDIIQFRVMRDHDNASTLFGGQDPYTDTVGVVSFDVHYAVDSFGSDEEYEK
jgi:hypothetical protein